MNLNKKKQASPSLPIHFTLFRQNILSDCFDRLASRFMKKCTSATVQGPRRFKEAFGVSSRRCVIIWKFLQLNAQEGDMIKEQVHPQHLLWTLFFLKVYATRSLNASLAGCDEKNFDKWIWILLEALASLREKYVSVLFYIALT